MYKCVYHTVNIISNILFRSTGDKEDELSKLTAESNSDNIKRNSYTITHGITDHEKYVILKNHFRPGEKYEFKKILKHGCYRYRNALFIALKRMVSIVFFALCF